MAIQSIQDIGGPGAAGGRMGQVLGQSLATGIQALAEAKMQTMQQRQKEKDLHDAYPNIPKSALSFLAGLEPKDLAQHLPAVWEAGQQASKPFSLDQITPEQKRELSQLISSPEVRAQIPQEKLSQLEDFLYAPEREFSLEDVTPEHVQQLKDYLRDNPEAKQMLGEKEFNSVNNFLDNYQPTGSMQQAETKMEQPIAQQPASTQKNPFSSLQKSRPGEGPLAAGRLDLAREKHDYEVGLETRKVLEQSAQRKASAEANLLEYKILKGIANDKDMRSPTTQAALEKLGLQDFNVPLTNQIIGKVVARQSQQAQSAFGKNTRLTNFLEQTFQRSLASNKNTAEAIQIIADMNIPIQKMEVLKAETEAKIIRQNGNRVPVDLDYLVAERIEPQKRQLEDEAYLAGMQSTVKSNKKAMHTTPKLPEDMPIGAVAPDPFGQYWKNVGGKLALSDKNGNLIKR